MTYNTIMIIAILVIAVIAVVLYLRRAQTAEIDEDYEDPFTVEYLTEYVDTVFGVTKRKSLKEMNLSRAEYEKERRKKKDLRDAEKQASFGDVQAKRYLKSLILSIICDIKRENAITPETIDKVIPFNDPEELTSQDKFEILLLIYMHLTKKGSKKKLGADAMTELFKRYDFLSPKEGTDSYIVTDEDIDDAYADTMEMLGRDLTYDEKKEVLAQRIFEMREGFGVVDMLLDQSIDEVQGGVSGVPTGSYKLKNLGDIMKTAKYSFESIWVVIRGVNVHLDFMSFGSQDELVRVVNNIYRYNAPNVLSRNKGKVVATMMDGSRIVAVRPEFCESYAFLARKFDSTPSIAPEDLWKEPGSDKLIKMLRWLVRSEQTIAITGDQGTGKTTALKSMIRFIPEEYSLRIQELTPELNIRYAYPDRNVLSFRETDTISSQEGLDLQKKTSGTCNIIGEVADAQAASWVIQTHGVASRFTIFTNHSNTPYDLITSFRNALMQVNNYRNERSADLMVANAINFDVHLERINGVRRVARITEIIPDASSDYPNNRDEYKRLKGASTEQMGRATMENAAEFFRRETDRISFKSRDILVFDHEKEEYVLLGLPSEEKQEVMYSKMSEETKRMLAPDIQSLVAEVTDNQATLAG